MIAEEAAKTGLEPIESRFSNEQQSSNNISSIKKDSSRTNTKKSKGSLKTVTDQPPESKRSALKQPQICLILGCRPKKRYICQYLIMYRISTELTGIRAHNVENA